MKQTVLITGIGKRLGQELATDFIAQGFHVVGTFRTHYAAIDELKKQGADLYQVDFYQAAQVEGFIAKITEQYAALRAVIHNASDWLPDNIKQSDEPQNEGSPTAADIMNKMMAIHVSLPYQLNLAFKALLKNNGTGFGDVIHISDYVAEKGSKKHIAYAASKAAMHSLTLSFAALLAPNVKVNTLSPALIKFNDHDDDAYKKKAFTKALIPKEAGFAEIINAVNFILNSEFMTGRNLQIDGGRHLK